MFRRSEKKIKAVFKMQFHATQVPVLKAKKLMISLVPVDDGKPTTRLPKAPILDGVCIWEKPVYETVKLVKEIKTGRIREKFYYVVVSTGSSKSGFLGEVSIDFADLVNANKPVNLNLPLQTSKSGTILNINVQRMNGEGSDSRHEDISETTGEDESYYQNLDSGRYSQGNRQKDLMSPESDDFSGETPHHDDQNGSLDDAESENSTSETALRNEVKMLERKLEVSEIEMQSLRKQIIKETRNVEQLTMQIVGLKEEKGALEVECEHLRFSRTWDDEMVSGKKQENDDIKAALENTKHELQNQRVSNKRLKSQLQEIEDSNSEYVLAMKDLSKKLDKKEAEVSELSEKIKALQSGSKGRISRDIEKYGGTVEEAENSKNMEKLKAEIELLKKEKANIRIEAENLTEDYESLETENKELYFKLEQTEGEKMEIEKSCKELSSEVKNLEIQVANLEEENERQVFQYAESLKMINNLEVQVDNLQEELKKQEQLAEQELEILNSANVELEKRAVRAEEALRKTRRSNADTIQKLKEEFEQLDAENSMRFEEYEKLTEQANAEARNLQKENETLKQLLDEAENELQILRSQQELNHNKHSKLHEESAMAEEGPNCSNESLETKKELEMRQMLKMEKEDLERQLSSVRKEAEKLSEENASMKFQINQKKAKEENLHLEVRKLRLKNNEVKNQVIDLKSEKEGLKKEISKLQDDLCKKEQNTAFMNSQDLASARETCSHTENSINNSISSSEVESLKEKNRRMEQELKEMHERYSEISLKFAEVEGERQQLVMSLRNLKGGKKN